MAHSNKNSIVTPGVAVNVYTESHPAVSVMPSVKRICRQPTPTTRSLVTRSLSAHNIAKLKLDTAQSWWWQLSCNLHRTVRTDYHLLIQHDLN